MNKTIFITGANKGIGFELCKIFLKENNFSVIALSRNINNLMNLKNYENLKIIQMDLEKYSASKLLDETNEFSQIDILINNAGALVNKDFTDININEWQKMFEVNLFAPVKIIRDLYPKLKNSGSAHIINIGSMGGFQGSSKFSGLSAYSSSKAALANLSESLAEEFRSDNIKVNCLSLGSVKTEMFMKAFPGLSTDTTSEEIAEFIYNFALCGNSFMNGKVLPVSLTTP